MKSAKTPITRLLAILLFLALGSSRLSADVITVDHNEPADFNSIQAAIDSVVAYATIEVRPGIYYENISYYGKMIVLTSTDPNDPNVVAATIIDANSSGNAVTFNNGEDENCVLGGFTIRNAQAGIYCHLCEPVIRNCVVTSNNTAIRGPGAPTIIATVVKDNMTGINDCDGDISDCEIVDNTGDGLKLCDGAKEDCVVSRNSGNGFNSCAGRASNCIVQENGGSGFYTCSGEIFNCIVTENAGSGLYGCGGAVENCIISANGATGCDGGNTHLANCLISANGEKGVMLWPNENTVTNCTVVGNKGDGICVQGKSGFMGHPILAHATGVNNIIVKNGGIALNSASGSTITSRYNNLWRNLAGDYAGNVTEADDISANPFFSAPGYWDLHDNWIEGEYHLMSTVGRWDVNDWVVDPLHSPSIDAGDPCSPLGVERNPNGARINQGCYGGTAEASKSDSGEIQPVCSGYPSMDFNKYCRVDLADFLIFSQSWLECNLDPRDTCRR